LPGVPVIGIPGQRCDVGNELAALAAMQRGGDAYLDAELVWAFPLPHSTSDACRE
jgi:hypothetical protein